MEGGDLSNEAAPRIVIVFEGTLAGLAADGAAVRDQALKKSLLKRPDYKTAAGQWELDRFGLGFVSQVTYHNGIPVDILSFLPREEYAYVSDLLDNTLGLPFSNYYWYPSRAEASTTLALYPHIKAIYDFEHPAYGHKSRTAWGLV